MKPQLAGNAAVVANTASSSRVHCARLLQDGLFGGIRGNQTTLLLKREKKNKIKIKNVFRSKTQRYKKKISINIINTKQRYYLYTK